MDYIRLRPTELPSARLGSGWLCTASLRWGGVGLARRGSLGHGLARQSHGLPNMARLGSARPWFVQRGPAWPGLAWLRFAPPTWLGLLSFSTKEGSELILTAVRLRRCTVLHRRVVLLYGVVKLLCFTQLLSFDLSWWRNNVVLFATIFQGGGTTSFCLRRSVKTKEQHFSVSDDLSGRRYTDFCFSAIICTSVCIELLVHCVCKLPLQFVRLEFTCCFNI